VSDQTSSLVIEVKEQGVESATGHLKELSKSAGAAEGAVHGLKEVMLEVVGPILTVAGAIELLKDLTKAAENFQILEARLDTVTGSAYSASVAFEELHKFAEISSFTSLDDATNAFVKLVNQGLDPSIGALKAFENIAAGTNSTLMGVVDSVSAASLGNYRSLREFGIKAKEEADGIAVTFHGNTEKIGKDAEDIQNYLVKIGNKDFASAAEIRAKGLEGSLDNVADAWENIELAVSNSKFTEIVKNILEEASNDINKFATFLRAGGVGAIGDVFKTSFGPSLLQAGKGFDLMSDVAVAALDKINIKADTLGEKLANVPNVWSSWIQNAAVTMAAGLDKLKMTDQATKMARQDTIDKGQSVGFSSEEERINYEQEQFLIRYKELTAGINQAELDTKNEIASQLDTATEKSKAAVEALRKAMAEAANSKGGGAEKQDDSALHEFKQLPGLKVDQNALDSLEKGLATEEKALQQSYLRRNKLIIDNTVDAEAKITELKVAAAEKRARILADPSFSDDQKTDRISQVDEEEKLLTDKFIESGNKRANLLLQNEIDFNEKMRDLKSKNLADVEADLDSETDVVVDAYRRRVDKILDLDQITAERRRDLLRLNDEKLQEDQSDIYAKQLDRESRGKGAIVQNNNAWLKVLKDAETKSGRERLEVQLNALTMMTNEGAKHSKIMFEINKVATVSQIALETPRAVAGAFAIGPEQGGPYLGAAFAAVALAAMLSQAAAAASASYGSSSSGGSTASQQAGITTTDNPNTPSSIGGDDSANKRRDTNFYFYGDINSNSAEVFMDDLKGLIKDGDHVLIEADSRNGRMLRGG